MPMPPWVREKLNRAVEDVDAAWPFEPPIPPVDPLPPPPPPPPPPVITPVVVKAGQSLQVAIDAAKPGDTILLERDTDFVLNHVFRNKGVGGRITITTDGAVPPGRRITPADAVGYARIRSGNTTQTFTAEPRASGYTLRCVSLPPATYSGATLVQLGSGLETDPRDLPRDFTFDSVYAYGDPLKGQRRAFMANCNNFALLNSHCEGFVFSDDSQCVGVTNGEGPFFIENNYLEAAGENVMVGGGDPRIINLVPSDGVVKNNHMFKPLAWKTKFPGTVKNLFEIKNGKRWLITGNRFENCWKDAQAGRGILFTVRNQDGQAPWSTVQDIEFTKNQVLNVEEDALSILTLDDIGGRASVRARGIRIKQNYFDGIGSLLSINRGMDDLVLDHNTFVGVRRRVLYFLVAGSVTTGFVFTNNLGAVGAYGVLGEGTSVGNATWNAYAPSFVAQKNVMEKSTASGTWISWPSGQTIVSVGAVRANLDPNSFTPIAGSTIDLLGTDGLTVGAPDLR